WKNRFGSMANPQTLNDSQIGVIVACIYVHPLIGDMRASVRRQADLAERFVKENPGWVLARSGSEALQAFKSGKRVMILALEGASGMLETEADLDEFIGKRGIRIVNLLHLTDDHFGGVAFLRGIMGLASPIAWLRSLFDSNRENGVKRNTRGLTSEGEALAKNLISRHVWIDLAHASDEAQKRLVALHRDAGLPLLYTHTALRKYLGAERGISNSQLQDLAQTGGFMGFMPSPDMLVDTPPWKEGCTGGIQRLARQYSEAAKVVGGDAIGLGTDYSGGIPHLEPPSDGCKTGTSLDEKGFWNISQARDVWKALAAAQVGTPRRLGASAERFLHAWARVNP
ncbi:MAG TPA: membrane dipeptidase, partial [Bdellovibrionota bacterium]|nr:membrane dipeptidase [Bdellovibrionota bacterium]